MSLEEALTAAERKALKKRIRTALVDRFLKAIEDDLYFTVEGILESECKAAAEDKKFQQEVRRAFRLEILKRAKTCAKEVVFYF